MFCGDRSTIPYVGGRSPRDLIQRSRWEAVSASLARLSRSSLSVLGGSLAALSRACNANNDRRSCSESSCLKRRRICKGALLFVEAESLYAVPSGGMRRLNMARLQNVRRII
jgi:hypothetical protein